MTSMTLYLFLFFVMVSDLKGDDAVDSSEIWNVKYEHFPLLVDARRKRQLEDNREEPCEDLHGNCQRWTSRNYCQHNDFKRFMSIKCRRSCMLCGKVLQPEDSTSSCIDRKVDCAFWAEQSYCTEPLYQNFMEINCLKSCKNCPEELETSVVSSEVKKDTTSTNLATTQTTKEIKSASTLSLQSTKLEFPTAATAKQFYTSSTLTSQKAETHKTTTTEPLTTTATTEKAIPRTNPTQEPTTITILTTDETKMAIPLTTKQALTSKETLTTATIKATTTPTREQITTSTTTKEQTTASTTKATTTPTREQITTSTTTTKEQTAASTTTPATEQTTTSTTTPTKEQTRTSTTTPTKEQTTTSTTTPTREQTTTSTTKAVSLETNFPTAATSTQVLHLSTPTFSLPTSTSSIQESFISSSLTNLLTKRSKFSLETSFPSTLTLSALPDFTSSSSLVTTETPFISSSLSTAAASSQDQPLTSSANNITISTTSTISSCMDRSNSCSFFAFFCQKSQFAQNNCKASCGLCPVLTTESTNALMEGKSTEEALVLTSFATTVPTQTHQYSTFTTDDDQEPIDSLIPTLKDKAALTRSSTSTTPNSSTRTISRSSTSTTPNSSTRTISRSSTSTTSSSSISTTSSLSTSTTSTAKSTSEVTQNSVSSQAVYIPTTQPMTTMNDDSQSLSRNLTTVFPFRTTTSTAISFRTTTQANNSRNNECKDRFEECANLNMFCEVNKNVRNNCKKTCNLCDDETVAVTTQATTLASTTPSNEICKDTFSKCVELISECRRPESISFLKQTCKKTCGFCEDEKVGNDSLSNEDDNDCKDDQEICETWSQSGFCDSAIYPELKRFMEKNCRRSCKLCAGTAWTQWTSCSLSCGGGEQTRTRTICKNGACSEPIVETRFCSLEVCPNNPEACEDRISQRSCRQYKARNACSTEVISALCSATCGKCEYKKAQNSSSPTVGEWLAWGAWSLCNATCNGGFQTRNRSCLNPPCNGSREENIACNTFRCHSCYDQSSNCRTMENFGACRKIMWKLYCKVTCGICRQAPIEGRCADANVKCSNLTRRCSLPSVAHACPVTCGRCSPPTEPPTTTAPTVTSPLIDGLPKICADKHSGCVEAPARNLCKDQRIAEVCPSSCGQCRKKLGEDSDAVDTELSVSTQCEDNWDFCPRLTAGCKNSSYVQENCPVSCNRCFIKKADSGCVDKNSACSVLARYGQCSNPTAAANCRLSCDPLCTQTSTLKISTTVATPSAVTPSCVDGHEKCPNYHALGQCSNDFIRFLCPSSCQACGEKSNVVAAPPKCQDKLGQICTLYQSQCSNSILQYGCEKTCGICVKKSSKCEDVLVKECQALGREGMCAMANFRNRCPVTCGACSDDAPTDISDDDDEKTVTVCFDQHTNCNQLRAFCDREPLIKTICRKTCRVCDNESSQKGFPCIDINPERCPRLQILGQCSSNSAVAFMCAKSCGKCVNSVVDCEDSYATCENFKQYCSIRSIQLQCARTCGVCGMVDQERTNAGVDFPVSSVTYHYCGDFIEECGTYKTYCGMNDWLDYMDTMCPKSCGACGISAGTWTKWSSWSQCSKSCNDDPGPLDADSGGNRTRTRQCIDGDYCEGGEAASVEVGKCNKDKCPELLEEVACVDQRQCTQWKKQGKCRIRRYRTQMLAACPVACGYCIPDPVWTAWSQCDASCGLGKQTRFMQCNYDKCKQTKNINSTEIRNCTIKECDGWTTWSLWSRCSSSCGIGSRLRIRSCKDGDVGGDMCPGSYLNEEVCGNNRLCASWSGWSSWGSCSLTCGNGTKLRNRTCLNASKLMTCEGSGIESDSCNEWSCFKWTKWGSWSNCSVPCGGNGTQFRFRKCPDINGSCGKKTGSRQRRVCGTEECSTWSEWSDWSECSVTCGAGGTHERTRTCRGGLGEMCVGNSVEQSECVSKKACIRWSNWSEYGECSVTCGGGYSARTRVCNPTRLDGRTEDEECPGVSVGRILCNCGVCPDVGVWSPWGDFSSCTVSCGGGEQIRRRLCLNGIPGRGGCQGPTHNTASCGEEECLIGKWDSWTKWSQCSATCGTGIRTKDRECIGGKEGIGGCAGNSEKMEQCNTHLCPYWSAWELWSGCSETCGKSGIRTRIKSCYDKDLNEIVMNSNCPENNMTSENEACNVQDCPTWAPWGAWSECSASCGVGSSTRERGCQNGLIGNLGCHDNSNTEKSFCNEWDCPAVCVSVPLNMKWKSIPGNQTFLSSDTPWLQSDSSQENNDTVRCLRLTVNNTDRWMQVSFRRPRIVSGISMKGFQDLEALKYSWVKKFLVLYGNDPDSLNVIYDNSGRPRLFYGPNGPLDTVYRYWKPTKAMYWRIQILASQPTRWVCMESELYRCRTSSDSLQGEMDDGNYFEGSGKI